MHIIEVTTSKIHNTEYVFVETPTIGGQFYIAQLPKANMNKAFVCRRLLESVQAQYKYDQREMRPSDIDAWDNFVIELSRYNVTIVYNEY